MCRTATGEVVQDVLVGEAVAVRDYEPADEAAWVRCRALAFLGTAYFDDVRRTKPRHESRTLELVAERCGQTVGLMDVVIHGDSATIETVAVDPDLGRAGVGSVLLQTAIRRLPDTHMLDAWTRDDVAANSWYLKNQFIETFRYLHVYATAAEIERAGVRAKSGLTPVAAFFHADIEDEAMLRNAFGRVHVCRRYERHLTPR